MTEVTLHSKAFREWLPDPKPNAETISFGRGRTFTYEGKKYTNLIVDEKHYSQADLAKAWGISSESIRQIFREEPGVLRLGSDGGKHTRSYVTLRIPQSVAVRVHARLSALPLTK
jgi:hypothetical protein